MIDDTVRWVRIAAWDASSWHPPEWELLHHDVAKRSEGGFKIVIVLPDEILGAIFFQLPNHPLAHSFDIFFARCVVLCCALLHKTSRQHFPHHGVIVFFFLLLFTQPNDNVIYSAGCREQRSLRGRDATDEFDPRRLVIVRLASFIRYAQPVV
jgi:hypothetical protein